MNARNWITASAAAIGLLTFSGVANASTLTVDVNLDPYGGFLQGYIVGYLPPAKYDVSMASNVPISLFGFDDEMYFSGSSYYPDGSYMGSDEGSYDTNVFTVDPAAGANPYAFNGVAVVPPPVETKIYYYPGGPLESDYITKVIFSTISLTAPSGGGQVVLTFTAVPEPSAWFLMLIGVGALGASLRARRPQTV